MEVKMVCAILFGLIKFVMTAEDEHFDRQPFGPKMCEKLCREIKDCSSYAFSRFYLHCQVANNTNEKTALFFNISQERGKSCPRNAKLILTKQEKQFCVKWSKDGLPPAVAERTGLLVVLSNMSYTLAQTFWLRDYFLSPYPNLSAEWIVAIAFVAKQRKLLVSRTVPRQLQSYHVDSGACTVLKDLFSPKFIGVDDDREIIFAVDVFNIVKMSPDGTYLTIIKRFKKPPNAIAVDSKKKVLFIGLKSHFVSLSYDGKEMQRIANSRQGLSFLTLDSTGNYIFYNNYTQVNRMSLDTEEKLNVRNFKHVPIRVVRYGEKYFVSFNSTSKVKIFNTKMQNYEYGFEFPLFLHGKGVEMCFI